MTNALCLIAGSIAGGLSRYYLSGFAQRISVGPFPYGTLAVNLSGCLVAGIIASLGERFSMGASARLLLITGFCGAFTTFSAFMIDSDFLIKNGHIGIMALNIVLSLIGGFILFRLGLFLGKI